MIAKVPDAKNKKIPGRKNRGSAVVEISLLMPIYIGVFFLYIAFFLFLIECGFIMQDMLEYMYHSETKSENHHSRYNISVVNQGNVRTVNVSDYREGLTIYFEVRGNSEDFPDKIRRWQIAVDTVS